ncbi:hypothetical protein Hamer_G009629 [Homarus americanus]|uniref:Uncharacterized protein n=1 Tax=Homarus americanus TaxID=6706 RepID=A0A8J5N2S1_HOMAM|nr:hypothetical protein Hamer_G009629 [Homarus americanus]
MTVKCLKREESQALARFSSTAERCQKFTNVPIVPSGVPIALTLRNITEFTLEKGPTRVHNAHIKQVTSGI